MNHHHRTETEYNNSNNINKVTNLLFTVLFRSSRIIDALGHTLTPLCPVRRQLSGLLPADAHALQVAFHDVHPVHPWPSQLPLVSFQFPLHGLFGGFWHPPFVGYAPTISVFFLWLCLQASVSLFSSWCRHFSLCPIYYNQISHCKFNRRDVLSVTGYSAIKLQLRKVFFYL